MRKYVLSRIKMATEVIILITILFFIKNSTFNDSTLTVALNTNLGKVLDEEVIENSQKLLYKQSAYTSIYSFNGDLTGYAGDCALCSGYLACPPRTNVLEEGIYYNDNVYGTIRIAASSKNYPCGTIIRFSVNKLSEEPIVAIILDRGVGGNDIDLLTENEDYAIKNVGRVRNLEFEVLREGWN
jgi:hypothetical protein